MIEIKNEKCFYKSVDDQCRVIQLNVGDKLSPIINTKTEAMKLAEEIENCGYRARVGKNIESDMWSVAII